jgi:putative phage-type endonuclease
MTMFWDATTAFIGGTHGRRLWKVHKNLIRISTDGMSREEWLEIRRGSVGGSDASAIVGLNNWSSPYSVWADKLGKLPEKPDNEPMRLGRDLENYVADRWCEKTGKKVRRANAVIRNPAYPFAHANIDRMVVGENAGLECKTTSILNLKRFKDGDYPVEYYVQCVHYMAVTGAERWYLGVLVLNEGFHDFVIERNEDDIKSLMEQEAELWEHVISDTPPPVDGSDATDDAIRTIYADSIGETVELFGRSTLIDEYYVQEQLKKTAEGRMQEIKQTLMLDMGDADTGFCGDYKITWKSQSRKTFNHKKYIEEHPSVDYSSNYKTSTTRPFTIKTIKENNNAK